MGLSLSGKHSYPVNNTAWPMSEQGPGLGLSVRLKVDVVSFQLYIASLGSDEALALSQKGLKFSLKIKLQIIGPFVHSNSGISSKV